MAALPLVLLLAAACLGAGLVPGVAPPFAVALTAAACLRPLPTRTSFRCCLWLLLALVLWTAGTTLPAGSLAGEWRTGLGADARVFMARYGTLCGLAPGASHVTPRLSLHPSGSLRWVVLLIGTGGMFCLTASLGTRQRILLAKGLVVVGGAVAAAGIVGRVLLPQGPTLVWWYPVADIGGGVPLGPFVNRNHFAALCALLAPLAMSLTCQTAGLGWRGAAVAAAGPDEVALRVPFGQRLLYGACLVAMMAGVLISRSRGGTAALLLGVIVMALLWWRRGPGAAALATLAGVAAIVLVTLWPDPEFQGRLHGMRDSASAIGARWPIWLDCGRVWRDVPLAGCGANAFGMVFPRVTAWAAGQQATHAESDLMQLLAEGGAVGALIVLGGLLAAVWPLLQALRQRGWLPCAPEAPPDTDSAGAAPAAPSGDLRLPYPLLAGVGGSLAAIGFASLVDIPLRVPLAAWATAAVAGLATPGPRRHGRSYHRAAWRSPERLAVAALLSTALYVGWHRPGWMALYRDRDAWIDAAATPEIAALLVETPTYWQAWYELGDRLLRQARDAACQAPETLRAAGWLALRSAIRSSPRDPRLRGALAGVLWQDGQWAEARDHRDAQLALLPADRGLRLQWLQAEWQAGFTGPASELAYRSAAEPAATPADAVAYLAWLADRELAEGSVTRARGALLAAEAREPGNARVLKGLVQCERRLGNAPREAEWLRLLAQSPQADAAVWWRLAELALDAADRTALQEALGMAVRIEPARRRAADELWKAFVVRQPRAPR